MFTIIATSNIKLKIYKVNAAFKSNEDVTIWSKMLALNVLLVSVAKIWIIFLPCPLYFMALLHFKAFKLIFVIFLFQCNCKN